MKKCILCDIDGVLVDSSNWVRYIPKERDDREGWNYFAKLPMLCTPNKIMLNLISIVGTLIPIIFVTSREDELLRKATIKQLEDFSNGAIKIGSKHKLLMRPYADYRDAWQVKRDLLENFVLPSYEPILAIDDEPDNILMFKSLGIPTWHYTKLRKKK